MSDDLFSSGGAAFQFNTFEPTPDVCRGTVLKIEVQQQTDFDGKAMFWADGRERKIHVFTLQTDLRDGANDDGIRTLWAKGGRYEIARGDGQSMRDAIVEAARAEGVNRTEDMIGGELAVAYTGMSKPTQRGYQPAKLYAAAFKKPPAQAADLFEDAPMASTNPDPF